MSFTTVMTYGTAGELSFDATLVEISGGLVRLKDLGGSTYSQANPTVETQHRIMASSLTSFANSVSTPGTSAIKYQLLVNDVAYYFDTGTSLWTAATGANYTEANTAAQINSNLSTLFSQLSISQSIYLRVRAFLHSAGSDQCSITTNTWVYGMSYLSPATLTECSISAYLSDLLGDQYTYDSTKPVTLYASAPRDFMHGSKLIRHFTKSAAFNSSGLATLSLIETETIAEYLKFWVTYYENNTLRQVRFNNAFVPNAPTRTLDQVTAVNPVDWS